MEHSLPGIKNNISGRRGLDGFGVRKQKREARRWKNKRKRLSMCRFSSGDFPRDGWDDTMRHHG